MTLSLSASCPPEWSSILSNRAFAHGRPAVTGCIKVEPEDFLVIEQMEVQPSGEGEHIWLQIRKRRQNTDQVAKQLARYCNVAYREVGYSGLKDFLAVTEQWFSIRLPKQDNFDWNKFEMDGVNILRLARHHRKIKRGTHKANHFSIIVRDLSPLAKDMPQRLELIRQQGVPNYFGPQRFGRDCNNMPQAQAMLSGAKRIKNRNLRGILLSAARAWLFNAILSERVKAGTWQSLQHGEPANLDGSGSMFNAEGGDDEIARLRAMDIHPTAPLWGEVATQTIEAYRDLHNCELAIISDYQDIADGLCAARLAYQRRPLRLCVNQLQWQRDGNQLRINFALQKGQFATSVLREVVASRDTRADSAV